jgi:hypothetical protein
LSPVKRLMALSMVIECTSPVSFSREVTCRMPFTSSEKVVIIGLPAGASRRPSMVKRPISMLFSASGSSPW